MTVTVPLPGRCSYIFATGEGNEAEGHGSMCSVAQSCPGTEEALRPGPASRSPRLILQPALPPLNLHGRHGAACLSGLQSPM